MSMFDSLAGAFLAPALAGFQGEPIIITARGGSPVSALGIVFRDQLQTRATDNHKRLEYPLSVQIPMASYPVAQPNVGGDTVSVIVRKGDVSPSTKKVSSIISQVGGMWHLALG
jgi:hypothetical protein